MPRRTRSSAARASRTAARWRAARAPRAATKRAVLRCAWRQRGAYPPARRPPRSLGGFRRRAFGTSRRARRGLPAELRRRRRAKAAIAERRCVFGLRRQVPAAARGAPSVEHRTGHLQAQLDPLFWGSWRRVAADDVARGVAIDVLFGRHVLVVVAGVL